MSPSWEEVDAYFEQRLAPPDAALDAALAANAAAGLPAIDVSALQGRFLELIVRMSQATRVLEIGTLGGYSTIHMARALGPGGRVVTMEIDPERARVAQTNFQRAGVADRIVVHVGAAADSLAALAARRPEPFDLVFIDADKPSNALYLDWALKLTRPGSVIIGDNVVRSGAVADARSRDASVQGSRALIDAIAAEPRLMATALQTVGAKGWDGFVMALVV